MVKIWWRGSGGGWRGRDGVIWPEGPVHRKGSPERGQATEEVDSEQRPWGNNSQSSKGEQSACITVGVVVDITVGSRPTLVVTV